MFLFGRLRNQVSVRHSNEEQTLETMAIAVAVAPGGWHSRLSRMAPSMLILWIHVGEVVLKKSIAQHVATVGLAIWAVTR